MCSRRPTWLQFVSPQTARGKWAFLPLRQMPPPPPPPIASWASFTSRSPVRRREQQAGGGRNERQREREGESEKHKQKDKPKRKSETPAESCIWPAAIACLACKVRSQSIGRRRVGISSDGGGAIASIPSRGSRHNLGHNLERPATAAGKLAAAPSIRFDLCALRKDLRPGSCLHPARVSSW